MKVYLALRYIPYEGDEILGAYSTRASAEAFLLFRRKEDADDYCEYVVKELELLA